MENPGDRQRKVCGESKPPPLAKLRRRESVGKDEEGCSKTSEQWRAL